jgi:hypothetical protein
MRPLRFDSKSKVTKTRLSDSMLEVKNLAFAVHLILPRKRHTTGNYLDKRNLANLV